MARHLVAVLKIHDNVTISNIVFEDFYYLCGRIEIYPCKDIEGK